MKNKILLCGVILLGITGCGVVTGGEETPIKTKDDNVISDDVEDIDKNKITTCSVESDGIKITIELTTDKSDNITKLKRIFRGAAPTKEDLEETYQAFKSQVETLNSHEGVSAKTSKNGLEISMTYEIDFTKISNETKLELNLNEFDYKLTKFKRELETDGGYTCK